MSSKRKYAKNPKTYQVLFVDDDINVLAALVRVFRKLPVQITTAESAEQACEIIANGDIDVLVADMKMPEASGTELMHWVSLNYPKIYRIILSGYASLEDAIKSINLGKVHQFLEKPWDNDKLVDAVMEGVKIAAETQRQVTELDRANRDKQHLASINKALAKRLEEKTQHVQQVFNSLKAERKNTQAMLSNVIDINPLLSREFALKTTNLAVNLGKLLKLDDGQINAVRLSAMLSQIGLLGVKQRILKTPFENLNAKQREEYFEQVHALSAVLLPKRSFAAIKAILMQQFERWDGKGFPDMKQDQGICIEARILAVARDFWRYVDGKMCESVLDTDTAMARITASAGTRYDPMITGLLEKYFDILVLKMFGKRLVSSQLEPGMVLSQPLYTAANMKLLPAGHQFTDNSINKIKQVEARQATNLVFEIDFANNPMPIKPVQLESAR